MTGSSSLPIPVSDGLQQLYHLLSGGDPRHVYAHSLFTEHDLIF
jgi:hypothetical protein